MLTAISRNDLRGFHKDLQEVVLMALDTGWTATRQSNGGIRLHAPDGETNAYVPMTTKPSRNVAQTLRRKVVKHADALRLAAVVAGSSIEQEVQVGEIPPEPPREPRHRAKVEEKPEAAPGAAATVVSERPFVAKKAPGKDGGTVYESQAIVERRWSDGTVDFRCSRCDYAHHNYRSVSAHNGKAHKAANAVEASLPVTLVDPAYTESPHRGYTPSPRLLAAFIEALGSDYSTLPPDALAERMLTWWHERPDIGVPGERRLKDLSAEECLQRIRQIADRGETLTLRDEVEALRVETAQAREALAEAQAAAARARGDLAAFRDLAASISTDD